MEDITVHSFLEGAMELPPEQLRPGTPPKKRPEELEWLHIVLRDLAAELVENHIRMARGCILTRQKLYHGVRVIFRMNTHDRFRSFEISLEKSNDPRVPKITITALKNGETVEPPPETIADLQEHLRDLIDELKPTPP